MAFGIIMGLSDTGHVGFLGAVFILAIAGIIFGFVGGIAFALMFTWVAPLLSSRWPRIGVGTLLGALAGLPGIFVADKIVGISDALKIGSIAGAAAGLACAAFSTYTQRRCTAFSKGSSAKEAI